MTLKRDGEALPTMTSIDDNLPHSPSGTDMDITNDLDEDDDEEIRHWKESPFAVGRTKPTWTDEEIRCCDLLQNFTPVSISACCCRKIGAGRVGNMVVLAQRMESYTDPATGLEEQRPKLLWVLGPYWMVLLCITLPIFTLLSLWTAITRLPDQSIYVIVSWAICTAILFGSLCMVSCRDPGILHRHSHAPPTDMEEQSTWRWSDQALSYRPKHALYDSECACVIENFDHTCPWTGTAIAKKNMMAFRIFLVSMAVTLLYDVVILIMLGRGVVNVESINQVV